MTLNAGLAYCVLKQTIDVRLEYPSVRNIPVASAVMGRFVTVHRSPSGSVALQHLAHTGPFDDFLKNPNIEAPTCPKCGEKMTFVYYETGLPKENEVFGCKLPDWNHPMLSPSYN